MFYHHQFMARLTEQASVLYDDDIACFTHVRKLYFLKLSQGCSMPATPTCHKPSWIGYEKWSKEYNLAANCCNQSVYTDTSFKSHQHEKSFYTQKFLVCLPRFLYLPSCKWEGMFFAGTFCREHYKCFFPASRFLCRIHAEMDKNVP